LAVCCQSRQTADALAVRRTRDTQIVLRDKCMHNRWRFLFLWISANALGLPIGWGVSNAIGSPFGGLAYGAIVVLALPALASTHQGNQVAKWAICWSIISLVVGFELPLLMKGTYLLQAMALSIAGLFIMVIPLLVIAAPFGIIWLLKVFVEPHPGEPPRQQILRGHMKSAAKVIMVWCGVCMSGVIVGVAIGMGSREVGEILGSTTTIGFNIGARAVLGVIGGTITGLALISASRGSIANAQRDSA